MDWPSLVNNVKEVAISSLLHCVQRVAHLLVAGAGDGEARARPEVLRDPVHAPHHVTHVHVNLQIHTLVNSYVLEN